MASRHAAVASAAPGSVFWTPAQPLAVVQTPWSWWFPLASPHEPALPASSCASNDVLFPSQAFPGFYSGNPAASTRADAHRRLLLDRSLFDLVVTHSCLELTDPTLLGWYLSLSAQDRRIIQGEGGFQQFMKNHPALVLYNHHVYAKDNVLQPTMTSSQHQYVSRSSTPGAGICRCGMLYTEQELMMIHNNVKSCDICHSKQPLCLEDGFQTLHSPVMQAVKKSSLQSQRNIPRPLQEMATCSSSSVFVYRDPAALASFSLDMELERCRQRGRAMLRSQTTAGQCGYVTCAEVGPLQSEWPTVKNESPPACSFHSGDGGGQSAEPGRVSWPVLGPGGERNAEEGCQDYVVCSREDTVDDVEANLSLEDQTVGCQSIMEEDESLVVCLSRDGEKGHSSLVLSGPVATDNEALAVGSEPVKLDPSPAPRVSTCDVMVGTERAPCLSAATQTERPQTADKHIITEVHMADLDYLASEFVKLRKTRRGLQEKKTMRSSGCKERKACDCLQRTQHAELRLLALQYSMCRQHCWRLYCTSTEGDINQHRLKDPPANIEQVLQKLESDYKELRDKIMEGVPLEQLKPLSVESEQIIAAASSYTPEKISGDELGKLPSWSSHESERHRTSRDKKECPESESTSGCWRKFSSTRGVNRDEDEPTENQTAATLRELTTGEAWYDAEEDLDPAEMGQNPKHTCESSSQGGKTSDLCVSNSTCDLAESDDLLAPEKLSCQVGFPALNNGFRCSHVKPPLPGSLGSVSVVSRPRPAEAAVGESERVDRGGGRCPASASIRGSTPPEDGTETTAPLSSSMKTRKVFCISPTAKGTFLPQQYGTMDGFETLMAELTRRHPDVGRQKIVDALLELRAQHPGVLVRLPLQTIGDMASELLARPANATQS